MQYLRDILLIKIINKIIYIVDQKQYQFVLFEKFFFKTLARWINMPIKIAKVRFPDFGELRKYYWESANYFPSYILNLILTLTSIVVTSLKKIGNIKYKKQKMNKNFTHEGC